MILRIKKGADGGGTMTMLRDDGTSTWQPATPYFVFHDLLHYAVESTLGFTQAFLGLVAAGRDFGDFEKGAKQWLPVEAHWAEIIAGQMQLERAGSTTLDEVATSIAAVCAGRGLAAPPIPPGAVARIAALHRELLRQWSAVPRGDALELRWPPPGDADRHT